MTCQPLLLRGAHNRPLLPLKRQQLLRRKRRRQQEIDGLVQGGG
jgi:hypothetical protein